jgi:hypothetical protein
VWEVYKEDMKQYYETAWGEKEEKNEEEDNSSSSDESVSNDKYAGWCICNFVL